MSGKAARIELTTCMREILTMLTQQRNGRQEIIVRARIILLAFERHKNQAIAAIVDRCPKTIGLWRRRWRDSFPALLQMEFVLNRSAYIRAIVDTLSDAPRSGSPGCFTNQQIIEVIALACKDPQNSGRPVTSWTGAELADEAQRRQLVDAISASHVNRVLREVNLKPHRSRYWCNTTEQDPEKFQREVETVCRTYQEAQQLADEQRTHTVCIDEMTSLQANERRAETKRARPGQPAREEFQYTRHGTVCVTANWHVTQGQLLATTITETRDNHDFARHIAQTIATDPQAGWVFVVDNLNTHCGAPLVKLVAEQLGIDPDTLGKVKREGVLKTMTSRREFLTDPAHRIRFVYLPNHSSWLNQIEIVFGIIKRRALRQGSFTSKQDLIEKLQRFIEYFNQHLARPMRWTYTGHRAQKKQQVERPRTWRELRKTRKQWQQFALVGNYL